MKPTISTIPQKTNRVLSWGFRIFIALAFLTAGSAKIIGIPMMVNVFDHIGIGQWFRITTGLVEIIGAIAVLVPVTTGISSFVLATTMVFAILTHLFVIGGNPIPAAILLLITATTTWLHRYNLVLVLNHFKKASN